MSNVKPTVDTYFPNLRREGEKIVDFGEPVEARKEVHFEIFQKYFGDHATALKPETPVAVLFMGGPASGKSSIREGYPDLADFVVLDNDEVKAMLPEYNALIANGDTMAAALVHDESSYITQILKDYAVENRYNILLDGVGANYPKYAALVQTLKERGYTIQIIMIDVAIEVALMRARVRKRQVPFSELQNAYYCDHVRENAKRLLQAYGADGAIYNSHTMPPSLIWLRGGSDVTISDSDYTQLFWDGHCPEKWKVE
jgi:hypothetical protein